ncbi:MAG: hypothetical protein EOP04_00310 [Proteobacteria bacterium]|nr:MAG: hypothetical protein EOP04_00310 [Pseudomonadota bacterium]
MKVFTHGTDLTFNSGSSSGWLGESSGGWRKTAINDVLAQSSQAAGGKAGSLRCSSGRTFKHRGISGGRTVARFTGGIGGSGGGTAKSALGQSGGGGISSISMADGAAVGGTGLTNGVAAGGGGGGIIKIENGQVAGGGGGGKLPIFVQKLVA